MVRWNMYSNIQQLKSMGLKKSQVARRLEINRKTVDKYWDDDAEEYTKTLSRASTRVRKLDVHEKVIVGWLRQHPDLSAAQIEDWLKERGFQVSAKERAIRSYVTMLRDKHDIPKPKRHRDYVAVADPPMGQQMQIDFGETKVDRAGGGKVKLYALGAVLSHSREKFGEWSDQPLTASRFVEMFLHCFEFYEGVPKEIVMDQDRLMVIKENFGDIFYTEQFEQFRQKMGFRIYLCRAGDPESKGRIEAVIKYLKGGFAKNRTFTDLLSWNQSCLEWLERTANQKVHGTTKKVPAEVFALEKPYLQPVPSFKPLPTDSVTRSVQKDNTILYKSNRYSLPRGTFEKSKKVRIEHEGDQLRIIDLRTEDCLALHSIALGQGKLIQSGNHLRDYTEKIEALYAQALTALSAIAEAEPFLVRIKEEKGRYIRDQLHLVLRLNESYSLDVLQHAIRFCHENQLYSAVDLQDMVAYLASNSSDQNTEMAVKSGQVPKNLAIPAGVRDIKVYAELLKAGAGT